jgi:hypothetical protein
VRLFEGFFDFAQNKDKSGVLICSALTAASDPKIKPEYRLKLYPPENQAYQVFFK